MMALKAASASGSTGFGAMSEKEGEMLQGLLGSLDINQDAATLKSNIEAIKASLNRLNQYAGGNAGVPATGGYTMPESGGYSGGGYDYNL
jgi:hypothetical protein